MIKTRHEIAKCNASDYETDYERNLISDDDNFYCIHNPENTLSTIGTLDNFIRIKLSRTFV